MTVVAGVDGCRAGWVAALVSGRGVRWQVLPDAAAVCALEAAAIAVDIPIGLPDGERRSCDRAASQLLVGASSRVFPTPPRAVLGADSYAEACGRSEADCGRRLSRQTWGIWPKVASFDAASVDHARVVEAHPELSFLRMAGRVLPRKHDLVGLLTRVEALRPWVDVDDALAARPRGGVKDDDCLDALACAWTAARWLRGEAEVLGGELDATGTPMRIVV
jgi:predicted RNase H-like nuclease